MFMLAGKLGYLISLQSADNVFMVVYIYSIAGGPFGPS
jgi:hypothetical protein